MRTREIPCKKKMSKGFLYIYDQFRNGSDIMFLKPPMFFSIVNKLLLFTEKIFSNISHCIC